MRADGKACGGTWVAVVEQVPEVQRVAGTTAPPDRRRGTVQPRSLVPWKNQFDPLSATISPKCFMAVRTTLASGPYPEMS